MATKKIKVLIIVVFCLFMAITAIALTREYHKNHPKKPDKRIAVVGSGPAGIIMSQKLQKRGYTNITIYGRIEDSQLETLNIDGVVVDTQACFLHPLYQPSIINMCKEQDFKISSINSMTIGDKYIEKHMGKLATIKFVLSLIKYSYLNKDPAVLGLSVKEFIETRDVQLPNMNQFLNGQLYGYPENVTVDSAFSWYSTCIPKSLKILWNLVGRENTGTLIVEKGYQTLFQSVLDGINAKKIPNLVYRVEKFNDNVLLTLDDGTKHKYDSVVVACPLTSVHNPLDNILSRLDYTYTRIFLIFFLSDISREKIGVYYNSENLSKSKYNVITSTRFFGKTTHGLGIHGALGYFDEKISEHDLYSRVLDQINALGTPVKHQILWRTPFYNHRWSAEAILNGNNIKAKGYQGKDNIWYGTAPFCHWNLDSIYEQASVISKRV